MRHLLVKSRIIITFFFPADSLKPRFAIFDIN